MDSEMSMAFPELYHIVVAAVLWSKNWIKKRIVFHCDNESIVNIINQGRSKVQDIPPNPNVDAASVNKT
jgi:hypothetical protein